MVWFSNCARKRRPSSKTALKWDENYAFGIQLNIRKTPRTKQKRRVRCSHIYTKLILLNDRHTRINREISKTIFLGIFNKLCAFQIYELDCWGGDYMLGKPYTLDIHFSPNISSSSVLAVSSCRIYLVNLITNQSFDKEGSWHVSQDC